MKAFWLHERKIEVMNSNIFSLVLAAGMSRRFGAPKQLSQFRGQALVRFTQELAGSVTGPNTVLVTGAQWRSVVDACTPFEGFFVHNNQYETGMASSIACGVRSIQPVADAVIIILADQPLITTEHLEMLQKTWQESRNAIVATEYSNIVGAPVIFPAAQFDLLLNLVNDQGARAVINRKNANVIRIPFSDAAQDIDTQADLRNI